jgi:hypothetical protein
MSLIIIQTANEIYNAKIRSGKYDHYGPELLDILYEDCIKQAAMMHHINSKHEKKLI